MEEAEEEEADDELTSVKAERDQLRAQLANLEQKHLQDGVSSLSHSSLVLLFFFSELLFKLHRRAPRR